MDVEIKEPEEGTVTSVYDVEPRKQKNLDFGVTVREVAKKFGVSKPTVTTGVAK